MASKRKLPSRGRTGKASQRSTVAGASKRDKGKTALLLWGAWSGNEPRQRAREDERGGVERIQAWCAWALSCPPDARIRKQAQAMNAVIDRVRSNFRETDLRNTVLAHLLANSASQLELRDVAPLESLVDEVFAAGQAFAESLSPELAARLGAHRSAVCDALAKLPARRREAVFVITNVLAQTQELSTVESRRKAERLFDRWQRVRRGGLERLP